MFPSQKPWDRRALSWGQLLLPASWGGRELTPREMNGGQLPIRNVSLCWGLAWVKSEPGPEGKQLSFPDLGWAVAKMQRTHWRSRELVLSGSQGSRGTLTPFPGRRPWAGSSAEYLAGREHSHAEGRHLGPSAAAETHSCSVQGAAVGHLLTKAGLNPLLSRNEAGWPLE